MNRLRKTKRAAQICVNDRIPILKRHSHGKDISGNTCVVNQDVGPAKIAEDLSTDFVHGCMVRNIDRIAPSRVGANCVDLVRDVLCVRFRATHARDPRSLICQSQGGSLANPSPRAGDDRNLIFESHKLGLQREK